MSKEHFVAFIPLGYLHHVEPVTRGVRWVAKAAVHAPSPEAARELLEARRPPFTPGLVD